MILDLREFADFPAEVVLTGKPDAMPSLTADVLDVHEVTARITVQKGTDEFFCQAATYARVTLQCSRCLTAYEGELNGTADFIVRGTPLPEANRRDLFDDEDYLYFRGNEMRVDVFEPVRQSLIVEVPMILLCRDNCRGLCPKCGVNLNETTCDCRFEHIDSRWEGLRRLTGNNQ